MAGYYYLVATLNDYSLDGDSKSLDFVSIRSEINENLSSKDRNLLDTLLTYYDIHNLLSFLDSRSNQFSPMGNYSKEEIEQLMEIFEEIAHRKEDQQDDQQPQERIIKLSPVFRDAIRAFEDAKFASKREIDTTKDIASILFTLYYRSLQKSGNKLVKQWGEFDRNIKNISAAYSARERKADVSKIIIGDGEVCQSILTNGKESDFLITGLDYLEEVIKLLGSDDILKKERGLDLLRWKRLDEMTTFDYFTIDYILAYVLKITMISRWLLLDQKIGREMFDMIIRSITHSSLIELKEE